MIFVIFILNSTNVSSQQLHNFCGKLPIHQASSSNPDSIVFDRFGNTYDRYENDSAEQVTVCNSGYFILRFKNSVPSDYQDVICQVFQEVSDIIPRRQQQFDCGENQNLANPQIEISGDLLLGVLAASSPLYDYFYSHCNYPLISNLVYRYINGGHDFFWGNNRLGFITINTSLNWNISYSNAPSNTQYDLRSVIIHQVLHLLGFYSKIGVGGIPAGDAHYDYYDHYLYRYPNNTTHDGLKVILGDCKENCWILNSAITNFDSDVRNSCSPSVFSYGIGDPLIAITSNIGDFGGNNLLDNHDYLSHLNEACNLNGADLLMRPKFLLGERRCVVQSVEKEILCKLGYKTDQCDGCSVIAFHERINNTNAHNCCTKLYGACVNEEIVINVQSLLCNDIGETKEISDVFFIVNPNFPNQNLDVSWNYGDQEAIVKAQSPGYYRLSYTTKGCDCKMDNAYVEIVIGLCCTPDPPCNNLVCTNGFEEFDEGCSLSYSVAQRNWAFEGSPNYCANFDENNNNKYAGLGAHHDAISGLCFKLKEPIMTGCALNISFKAFTNEIGRELILMGSETPPCDAADRSVQRGCIPTACDGYLYEPMCISNGIPIAQSSVFGSYSINNYTNTGPPINYIIIYTSDYNNMNYSSIIYLDDVVVTANCPFNSNFSFLVDCTSRSVEFTGHPNVSGLNFSWDLGDGNNASGRVINHIYADDGTYSVVLTVTDECGNSKTSAQSVIVNCNQALLCNCTADYVVGDQLNSETNITQTQIPSNLGYKTICINGRLNIDRANQILNHCTIYFAPGASIHVLNGSRLSTLSSTYLPCKGKMYQGIVAESGSTFFAIGNTIHDAEIGVQLDAGANVFKLTQNTFKNNYIGISMPNGGDFSSTIQSNNNFYTETGLLPPRSGEKGYTGIYMNEAFAAIRSSDFLNLRNGIVCENKSILFVEDNCEFTDMIPLNINSVAGVADGIGIYIDRSIISVLNCTITNSLIGISTNNSWILNISDNTIQDDRVGIHDRFSYGPGTIVDNHINEYREQGIRIDNPSEGIFFMINDNILTNQMAQPSSQMEAAAIFLDNVRSLQALTPTQLVHNIIMQKSSHKGIFARNCNNIAAQINEVHYNGFDLYGNSGIDLQNVNNSAFYSNTVDGQDQNNYISDGFNSSMAPLNIYCCNDVDFTTYGFRYSGDCDRSIWRQNLLNTHYRSLFIQTGAFFGEQPNFRSGLSTSPGDQWGNTLYQLPGSYHAYNGNGAGSILTDASRVFPNTCNSPYWPSTIFPSQSCSFAPQWFTLVESPVTDCVQDEGCPPLNFGNPLINNDDYLTLTDTFIASGEMLNEDHGACLNFEGQKRLFAKLHEHPELRDEGSPIDSFYLINLNTDLYGMYKVDSLKYKAMSCGSQFIDFLNTSEDSIRYFLSILKTLDSLYAIATNHEDSTFLENQMLATSALLEGRNVSIVYELDQLSLYRSSLIGLAESFNNSITENDLLYSNLVSVNKIYLKTIAIGVDSLTTGQIDTLYYISNQCPLDGGKAVYLARSLYNLYAPLDINDDSICISGAPIIISNSSEEFKSKVNYYPVPMRDEMVFELKPNQDSEYKFSLIDVSTGRIVKEFKIENTKERNIRINISEISEGMYIFTLKSKGLLVSTGKVVKIN